MDRLCQPANRSSRWTVERIRDCGQIRADRGGWCLRGRGFQWFHHHHRTAARRRCCGQFEDPATEEIVGIPRYRPHDRKQADRGRRTWLPNDNAHRANRRSCPEQSERALSRRDLDAPWGLLQADVLGVDPTGCVVRSPRKSQSQPAAAIGDTRARHDQQPQGICRRQPARRTQTRAGQTVKDSGERFDLGAPGDSAPRVRERAGPGVCRRAYA